MKLLSRQTDLIFVIPKVKSSLSGLDEYFTLRPVANQCSISTCSGLFVLYLCKHGASWQSSHSNCPKDKFLAPGFMLNSYWVCLKTLILSVFLFLVLPSPEHKNTLPWGCSCLHCFAFVANERKPNCIGLVNFIHILTFRPVWKLCQWNILFVAFICVTWPVAQYVTDIRLVTHHCTSFLSSTLQLLLLIQVKSVINLLFAAYTGDVSALRRYTQTHWHSGTHAGVCLS